MIERGLLLLSATLFAACGSLAPLGTARTLDPGALRWGGQIDTGAVVLDRTDVGTVSFQMGAGLEVGVVDGFELGFRAWGTPAPKEWTWGADIQTKIQLTRPDRPVGGFDISVAPRLAFSQVGKAGATWERTSATLAVLVGWNPDEPLQVIFAPQIGGDLMQDAGSNDVWAIHAGGSLGVAYKVQACVTVLPYITFLYTSARLDDEEPIWMYQLSVALLLDG